MATIQLLEPVDGSVTQPLQQYYFPTDKEKCDAAEGDAYETSFRWDSLEVLFEDRTLPRAVTFAWKPLPADKGPVDYDLAIARNPDFGDALILKNLSESKAEIWHLCVGTRYFWKVTSKRSGRAPTESPVWRFTTNRATPRWIGIPGMTNVRDMGGWSLPGDRMVRQGLLYRGSAMNNYESLQITDGGKRILIHELGIRTDLDLRKPPEEAKRALDQAEVQWINVPIEPYDRISDEVFEEGYRRIFAVLAEASNYPMIFHCLGGADRAGTVAFLLNALLGVSKEHLIRDYELTSLSIWGERSRSADYFKGLLNALASFGKDGDNVNEQVENYLRAIGVTQENIASIRTQLIVDRKDT